MGPKPQNTIFELRSELHQELLDCSAIAPHRFGEQMMIGVLMVAVAGTGIGIALQSPPPAAPPPAQETVHMAAPPGYTEDEKDIDDTEMVEFVCNEFCRNDSDLFATFCFESCPYLYQGKGEGVPVQEAVPPEAVDVKHMEIPLQKVQVEEITVPVSSSPLFPGEETSQTLESFGVQQHTNARQENNQIGVYLTATSVGRESKLEDIFSALDENVGNAFVFDVKGSYVYFESSAPLASELKLVRPTYDLPAIIQRAKDHGLYTIGRFIVAKDPSLAGRKPETQIQNVFTGKGLGSTWVNPGHETVLEYNRQILRDVVASGVDEVNFDYIRFPTEYSPAAVGLSGTEKADLLEMFLQMARRTVEELGADTKLGISTYAILGWNFPVNFEPLGQDIARFAPLVDVISPMAYPSTFAQGAYYNPAKHPGSRMYYLVYRTMQGYRELLGDEAWKLRPWIQGYYVNARDVRDQAQAVYDSGSCGFTIWSAQNLYGPSFAAFEDLQIPEECR